MFCSDIESALKTSNLLSSLVWIPDSTQPLKC